MLLARVAAELRTNGELSRRLLPVRLKEESHQEIFNLADFWLDVLFHLAAEIKPLHPEFSRELSETHSSLSVRWGEQGVEGLIRAAVLDATDRLGSRLVLMVENFQALCLGTEPDFGWKLRATLQTDPQVMLLATATSRFKDLEDAEKAFFELFRRLELGPLGTEDCRRLWQSVSGEEVRGREIRPLEILTGGSPRLLVIVAGYARHRSLDRLMEELVGLVDQHTEYFRGNLESMPKTERRVFISVIDSWRPSRAGEIATRARMDVRVVSTMLGRLVARGAVVVMGTGKRCLYRAAEGLYSIYYKIRRERDEAAVVESLLRFMAAFYGRSEREDRRAAVHQEATSSLARLMELSGLAASHRGPDGSTHSETVPATESPAPTASTVISQGTSNQETGDPEAAVSINESIVDGLHYAGGAKVLEEVASVLGQRGQALKESGEINPANAAFDDLLETLESASTTHSNQSLSPVLAQLGKRNSLGVEELVASALASIGVARLSSGDLGEAVSTFDHLVVRFGDRPSPTLQPWVANALVWKGKAREVEGATQRAIAIYDDVIVQFRDCAVPGGRLAITKALKWKAGCLKRMGDLEGAIKAMHSLVKHCAATELACQQGEVEDALIDLGTAELEGGRTKDAMKTCADVEKRLQGLDGEKQALVAWRMNGLRSKALASIGEFEAATSAFERAFLLFDLERPTMISETIDLAIDLTARGMPMHRIAEILQDDAVKSGELTPLVLSLQLEAGEPVRAPVEMRLVADDISQKIREKRRT